MIGNADYETAPLRNPVNDTVDVARALRTLGFEVIEKTDAGKREMIFAVDEFAKRFRDAEIGLFPLVPKLQLGNTLARKLRLQYG